MSAEEPNGRVMIISLDAFELAVLRQGVEAGWLPVLAGMLRHGASVRLESGLGSTISLLPGSVWPSTITGRPPEDHLLTFDRQLRPGSYRIDNTTPAALRHPPFWRYVSDSGRSSTIVSVYAAPRLQAFLGTQVLGWGTSDPYNTKLSGPWVDPPEVLGWLDEACHGRRRGFLDKLPTSQPEVQDFLDDAIASVDQQTRALTILMERTRWDLFFGNFFEAHEAGHLIWHLSDRRSPLHDPDAPAETRDAIRRLYVALDTAVGRLLSHRPEGVTAFVLSPHGMGPSNPTYHVINSFLTNGGWLVERTTTPTGDRRWWVVRARSLAHRLTSVGVRRALAKLVPTGHARLLAATRLADVDWTRTRAFPLPHDRTSLIRVNLAGREPQGTVEPGADYDRACRELAAQAMRLVDGSTGEPVARATFRIDEVTGAPVGDVLPDVVITWNPHRPEWVNGVGAPISADADDPRTGDHTAHGFIIGIGPGIEAQPGHQLDATAGVLDVAPTVLRRLGVGVPPDLAGTPIELFAAD